MRRMLAVALGMMLAASALRARAQDEVQTPPTDDWGKLVAANNLDVKGNTPFHLGMTFQLYDLNGKPEKTGSFEVWWTAPGKQRSVVHLDGLNENGIAPEGANVALVRDSYLVGGLLEAAIHPVPIVRAPTGLLTRTVKFGKIELECIGPKPGPMDAMNARPGTACVTPHTTDVLILQGLGGNVVILRPGTGKFHSTCVALNLRIAYIGKDAIAGKLTNLQTYESTNLTAEVPEGATSGPSAVRLSGGVNQGQRIKFAEPTYPEMAKVAHLSGSVLLHAVIAKDGSVQSLVPIASTATVFVDSAMEAVRRWRYSPFLLNGEPTEVDTMITVNFGLNGY
jgi:TonB family protein